MATKPKLAKRKPAPVPAASAPVPQPKPDNVVTCDAPPPPELDKSVPHLKHLGGGQSDKWNQLVINQAMNAAWYPQDITAEAKVDPCRAILGFLAGVNPTDTIEGMMAAQLFASHASAMECYRRAMLPGQPIEAKEMLLSLAAKLTRANAAQVEALKKHRSNGQQKVIVEHVHVYQGGQAIVGNVTPGGLAKIRKDNPMLLDMQKAPRCGAKTRSGKPCRSPGMANGRCRMHGGPSPGAPKGNQNAFKHGRYSALGILQRRQIAELISGMRETASRG